MEIAEKLQFEKCMPEQETSESFEGLGCAVLMDLECKRGKCPQSPSSKFFCLRLERDSWQIFTGQEISFYIL